MIETIGFWASFGAGLVLLVMCLFGVRAFFTRAWRGDGSASHTLSQAIVLGFIAAGLNALYWQVGGQWAIANHFASVPMIRLVGSYLDVAFKLIPAVSIYMHLEAWRKSLPPRERSQWSALGMAFYPKRTGFLSRALNKFSEKQP